MLDIVQRKVFSHIFPVVWLRHEGGEFILTFDDLSIFRETDWVEVIDGVPHICRTMRDRRTAQLSTYKFKPFRVFPPTHEGWVDALFMADYLDISFSNRMTRDFHSHPENWASVTVGFDAEGNMFKLDGDGQGMV